MTNQKSSVLLRRAAQAFERGEALYGLCHFLDKTLCDDPLEYVRARRWLEMIRPDYVLDYDYWFGEPRCWDDGADQSVRILAACFAAAIAESEGD